MAHFYGSIQGNRGEATRGGSKGSGYTAQAASWEGSVRVDLTHDESTGKDLARVSLERWHGAGTSHLLYAGPVGEFAPERGAVDLTGLAADLRSIAADIRAGKGDPLAALDALADGLDKL